MEQEASEEFLGVEGEPSFSGEGVAVANGERDGGRIEGDEAVVGDADPVGVIAKVAKHVGGVVEGAFGVDDPGFLVESIAEGSPGQGILQVGETSGQMQLALLSGFEERLDEEMFEAFPQNLDRQEVARTGVDPTLGIRGEPACRDDAMDVGVMGEVLRPGVQHGGEPDLGAKVS